MKRRNRYGTKTTAMGVLLALATAAFLMLPTIAAEAHDTLESTVPANGSVVRTVPTQIVLTFDHTPLAIGSVIRVEDANGIDRADGPVAIVDNRVTQAIIPGAPEGKYTVIWRVASADGHAIEGTFTFTAGTVSSTADPNLAPSAAPPVTGASTSAGPPTGIFVAAVVALLLAIAFVWLAVTVKRRLSRPDS
jgi:methionine-rich copper-binding protein CopC